MSADANAENRSLRERLVGSWRLVSYEARQDDGRRVIYPLGKDARGYILYTPDGYMSAQIMQPDRPPYRAPDPSGGTLTESAQASRGYLAYSGPYHVEGDSIVVHEPQVSLFPNWVDEIQSRRAVLSDRRLELSATEPVLFGEDLLTAVLVWERA
ncbi:MAG TPA: lipocalin-like domain-containing protein [Pseudonocardia sp.]|uniref:lipocalin-like domain-containing protein n=1 Tax=Pseudonocardia sp. TaxID=60912 RepID=UPI002C6A1557|nr:lipocalin-like domain-containing protein [Pseudonocardia sp.]HTF53191.1 lipocalin-like domain-containing protein [Pseudonocardia sp.]